MPPHPVIQIFTTFLHAAEGGGPTLTRSRTLKSVSLLPLSTSYTVLLIRLMTDLYIVVKSYRITDFMNRDRFLKKFSGPICQNGFLGLDLGARIWADLGVFRLFSLSQSSISTIWAAI